jgi:ribosomal protein L24
MKKQLKKHVKVGDRIQIITGNQKGVIGTYFSN